MILPKGQSPLLGGQSMGYTGGGPCVVFRWGLCVTAAVG